METQSGWSFQQGKWLSELTIDPSEQLQAARRLLTALYGLNLLQRWGALFALAQPLRRRIALLSEVSLLTLVCWAEDIHIALATAIQQQKGVP